MDARKNLGSLKVDTGEKVGSERAVSEGKLTEMDILEKVGKQ